MNAAPDGAADATSPSPRPEHARRPLIGAALVAISAIGFGFMPLFASWTLPDGLGVPGLLSVRFGIAAALLWVVVLARAIRVPRGLTLGTLIVMGVVLYFGESYGYYSALRHLPSGVVALILYVYPALVAVLARVLLAERLTRAKLAALGLAALGLALTLGLFDPATFEAVRGSGWTGITLALLSAVSYAAYMIAGARVGARASPIAAAAIVATGVAATHTVIALATGDRLPHSAWGWAGAVALALVGTVLSLTTLLAGIRRIGPTRAATISCIEPVATAALGAAFLGERLTASQWLGGLLILAGAVLAARAGRTSPAPPMQAAGA